MPTAISAPASTNDGTRGAEVIVAGKRCPIAGRISMDLIAVDITDLPPNAARRGHMVTLIGEGITVDELAHHFGTIGYEVLTSLGRRYARVYKGGGPRPQPSPQQASAVRSIVRYFFCASSTFLQGAASSAYCLFRQAMMRPPPGTVPLQYF